MKAISILLVAFLNVSTLLYSQCNVNGFTVNSTNGTCLSNGIISIQVPGANSCSGWTAVLTNGSNQTFLALPSHGNVSFTGLQPGVYNVQLTNGLTNIQSLSNPIVLTTSYLPVVITQSYVPTTCSPQSQSYSHDGNLTVNVQGGTGPFLYTVVTSLGTFNYGPTMELSHIFTNLAGGEVATITVRDDVGGITGCQNSTSKTYFLQATAGIQFTVDVPSYSYYKQCPPNCNSYSIIPYIANASHINRINLPGNATIRVNGGSPVNLSPFQSNGEGTPFTLNAGDSYVLDVTDGCFSSVFNGVVPIPTTSVRLTPINQFANCVNAQYIEYLYSRVNWCLNTQTAVSLLDTITNTYIPISGSPFNTTAGLVGSIPVPRIGTYQLTISDGCQTTVSIVVVNPPIDANPAEKITNAGNFNTLLDNAGSIIVGGYSGHNYNLPQSGVPYPVTVQITPTDGRTSITHIADHPFQYAGTYTVNFPISRTINNGNSSPAIFTDIPAGIEYRITTTDNCGNVATRYFTPDSVSYKPIINIIQKCGDIGSLQYNLNSYGGQHRFITYGGTWPDARYALYTDNGFGQPGTLIPGFGSPSFLSGDYKSGVFENLPSGKYVVRFWQFTRAGWNGNYPSNSFPESSQFHDYSFPFEIKEYEDITISYQSTLCEENVGSVVINIDAGTAIYPLVYNLYDDNQNLIKTDTIANRNSFSDSLNMGVLFTDLNAGNYVINVISGYTLSTPLGCYSAQMNLTLDNSIANLKIASSDTIVCITNNLLQLGFPINSNYWDITWKTIGGTIIASDTNRIEVHPDNINSQYLVEYQSSYDFGCLTSPIYSDTISLTVVAVPDTITIQFLGDSICPMDNGLITIFNTQNTVSYSIIKNGVTIDSIFNERLNDSIIFIIDNSVLSVGNNFFDVKVNSSICGELTKKNVVNVYMYDGIRPEFLASDEDTIVTCSSSLPSYLSSITDVIVTDLDTIVTYVDSFCISNFTRIVTYIATNQCGFSDTLIQKVKVFDSISPTINFVNNRVEYAQECNYIVPNFVSTIQFEDNCNDLNDSILKTQNPSPGVVFGLGTHEIIITAKDYCVNNLTIDTLIVTVLDTVPPIFQCPNDTTVTFTSCQYLMSDFRHLINYEGCSESSDFIYVQFPSPNSTIQIDTVVEISIMNSLGVRIETCQFQLDFTKNYTLTYDCNVDKFVYSDVNCVSKIPDFSSLQYSYRNDCDSAEQILLDITQSPVANTTFSDSVQVWIYFSNGIDIIDSCSFYVVSIDTILPTIKCPENMFIDSDSNCSVSVPDVANDIEIQDNCTSFFSSSLINQLPVSGTIIFDSTEVEIMVFDESGNTVSCKFFINIHYPPISFNCVNDKKLEVDSNCLSILSDYTSELSIIESSCSNNVKNLNIIQFPSKGTMINTPTEVHLYIYDSINLLDSCLFNVIPGDLPIANFKPSPDELFIGETSTMINFSSGSISYTWDFGNGSTSNDIHPIHIYSNENDYIITLIATSINGCSDTSYATIRVLDQMLIFVPNAFTPDGSEFNNVFKPVVNDISLVDQYNMLIFNRWGECIFESNDINLGWDGTFKEIISQDGVYTWKIKITTSFNSQELNGHLTLIR